MKKLSSASVLMSLLIINFLFFYFISMRGLHIDESFQLSIMDRWSNGEIPYKDFYVQMPPLGLWFSKVFYVLFHRTIFGMRVAISLLVFATGIVYYFAAKKITNDSLKALIVAVTGILWSQLIFPVVSYTPMAIFILSLGFFIHLKFDAKDLRYYFFQSVLGILLFASKQNLAGALFILFVVNIVKSLKGFELKKLLQMVGVSFVGGLLGILVVHLLIHGMWSDFIQRTVIDMRKIKNDSYNIPFSEKPLKSLIFSVFVLLGIYFIYRLRSSKLHRVIQASIAFLGVVFLLFCVMKPERMFDHLNWYFTIYFHNVVTAIAIVALICSKFEKKLYYIAYGFLVYYLGIFAGYDINHVLTSSYFLMFVFALIAADQRFWGLSSFLIFFAFGFAIAASPSGRWTNGEIISRSNLPLLSHLRMPKFVAENFENDSSDKRCAEFSKTNDVYMIQDMNSSLGYLQPHVKNYWWYLDPAFSAPWIDEGIAKDIENLKRKYLVFFPGDVNYFFKDSFPLAYGVFERMYKKSSGDCQNIYELK